MHTNNSTTPFVFGITQSPAVTKFGGGVLSDGTGYITIAHIAGDKMNPVWDDPITISFYIKSATITAETALVVKAAGLGNEAGYKVFTDASGNLVFKFSNGTTSVQVTDTMHQLDDNVWHAVVCAKDLGSNRSKIDIYVDDQLTKGSNFIFSGDTTNTNPIGFFADSLGANRFTGSLAHVMVSEKHLLTSDISDHLNGLIRRNLDNAEITYMPFETDLAPRPNATVGRCRIT